MSQDANYSQWTSVALAFLTLGVIPLMKRIFSSVTRKEFQEYLEKRDQLSEDRHNDNLNRFDRLLDDMADTRERLSRMEGSLSGSYRRP